MRCFFRECDFDGNEDLTDEICNYVAESQIRNGHVLVQPLDMNCAICFGGGNCLGVSLNLVIFGGVLQLGREQRILFLDSDDLGRKRRFVVSIIGA